MADDSPLMYSRLAGWFHLLTPPHEYAGEAAEVHQVLGDYVKPPLVTVLELGSGGGNLASHLSGQWQMTLTDPEPEMLNLSRTINRQTEHLEGDMRTLRLGRTFDAVIIHDAIVYMTTQVDLRAAFDTAFTHLRAGGAAIFLPDWVADEYAPSTEVGGTDEAGRGLRYLEWDRPIEPDGHTVITDYVIITRTADGVVEIFHDAHTQGIFSRAIWMDQLEAAGFEAHRFIGAEGIDVFVGVHP